MTEVELAITKREMEQAMLGLQEQMQHCLTLYAKLLDQAIAEQTIKDKPVSFVISRSGCRLTNSGFVHTDDCSCDDEVDEAMNNE